MARASASQVVRRAWAGVAGLGGCVFYIKIGLSGPPSKRKQL